MFFELLPGSPILSRDNLDSMKVDNVVDPVIQETTARALGIKLTPLEAVVHRYLGSSDRLDDFRARAGR
jgi:NADH dehydrogenase